MDGVHVGKFVMNTTSWDGT